MQAWFMAIRPKTLTAAIIPIMVASALAYQVQGSISGTVIFCTLIASLAIQIGTNLINDALDFKKGADTEKRLGPKRVTQTGLLSYRQVFAAGLAAFSIAIVAGIPLIVIGGVPIALLLILSVACGYLYTGGPKPLAYCGLGDLFVLLFFGLASTMAVFYLHTGTVQFASFVAGIQVGLLATVLIAINNLRDHVGDEKANKRTLAVRFGVHFSRWEITLLALLPFLCSAFWWSVGFLSTALLPLLTLPLAVLIIRRVWQTEPDAVYNKFLAQAALLHLSFGTLLAVSLI